MPGDPVTDFFSNNASLSSFFNSAFTMSISIGAILALFRIVWAGYLYMGSADMWSSKQHAKDVFRDAIVGLLLLLAIWLILNLINPCILDTTVLDAGQAAGECHGAINSAQNGLGGTPQ